MVTFRQLLRRRPTRNGALYAVVLALACACVVGGVLVYVDMGSEPEGALAAPTVAEQQRYGAVKRAAEETATALINIDYRNPGQSREAVSATATGKFLEQYQASSKSLEELVTQYKSVMEGQVVTSAVSNVDEDSATVLVATEGEVRNAQTGDDVQARNFRLLVELVRQDGEWLTSGLDFVG